MDFNTLLARFGFDSSNFVNKIINTVEIDEGIIYEVEERCSKNICLFEGSIEKHFMKPN